MRLSQIQTIVVALLFSICVALFYMQVIRGAEYYAQSVNNRIRIVAVEGPRGRIVDRNGTVLADNRHSFNLGVAPQDIQDKEELFKYLGQLLKRDPVQLQRQFQAKRRTPFSPVIIAEDVGKDIVVKAQEDKMIYPGLVVQEGYERFYPMSEKGAHVLGYVGKISSDEIDDWQGYGYTLLSVVGKSGLEKMYNNTLRGMPGGRQIEINSRGREVRVLGLKEPTRGEDVMVALDARLQGVAQELLGDRRGAIVVMDLKSGEILTMVSSPAFNPNAFSDRSRRDLITGYLNNSFSPLMNRAISGQFPPGSVFKIPVALAAVQLNKITLDTTFNCPGYLMLGQTKFGCAHVHGVQDLIGAIAHSCNVYFFHIGKIVNPANIGAYARAFGFARRSGIDLPFEAKGRVVSAAAIGRSWYMGNTFNLSIGQGETLATPLQITVMMAAVANDGVILKPRVARMFDKSVVSQEDFTKRPTVRLRDDAWRSVEKGMRAVVTDQEGTGHELNDLTNMTIWGKTGTAQAGADKANHAWFAGYARSFKNNIAFCIFLEHGGSSANSVALTKELLVRMQSLNII